MEYGALVKLVEWYGNLIAVMEHGIINWFLLMSVLWWKMNLEKMYT